MPIPAKRRWPACQPAAVFLLLLLAACNPQSTREVPVTPTGSFKHTNRLIHEKSPYLQQHAHNPVDWHSWGEEAFEAARSQGKPIFLSIGYATCHWCHVMERESFEDENIAAILNRFFVPIKVDREERPDVDQVYMTAVQLQTGSGGWPLSAFLTPDLKPFYTGTYFPPDDRYGRPGFKSLLLSISQAWEARRGDMEKGGDKLVEAISQHLSATPGEAMGEETLRLAYSQMNRAYDPDEGGFGHAPKFPRPHALQFLLRYWKRTGEPKALEMATFTLKKMADGGMYDHLGGGFARYSTDPEWLVPHFEKMLYDNAQLASTYLEAWQATGDDHFAAVAEDIFGYVLRDMASSEGGFYSAEDADSEGVEGKFYVWTPAEVEAILGKEDAGLFNAFYDVTDRGNFEGESILHPVAAMEAFAKEHGLDAHALHDKFVLCREKLFREREKRIHPLKDDKILTAWNALMISALATGGRALERPRYTQAAVKGAEFVLRDLEKDGRLLARYRDGEAKISAYLDDYAFLGNAFLDLYAATCETRWLKEARRKGDELERLFFDAKDGAFQFTGSDTKEILVRGKDIYDGAMPSGNSVAALLFARLAHLSDSEADWKRAEGVLRAFSGAVSQSPYSHTYLLMALDYLLGPREEIVVAGDPAHSVTQEFLREATRGFHPNRMVLLHHEAGASAGLEALAEFVAAQGPGDGKPAVYVCRDYACKLPVTEVEALRGVLGAKEEKEE